MRIKLFHYLYFGDRFPLFVIIPADLRKLQADSRDRVTCFAALLIRRWFVLVASLCFILLCFVCSMYYVFVLCDFSISIGCCNKAILSLGPVYIMMPWKCACVVTSNSRKALIYNNSRPNDTAQNKSRKELQIYKKINTQQNI